MKTNGKLWFWIVLCVVAVLAVILIFRGDKKTDDEQHMNTKFEYEVIEISQNEYLDEPSEVLITTIEEWDQYCSDTECFVDFTQKMIAGYNLGMRPNSGYALQVENVEEKSDEIVIYANAIEPGKDCITMQVITYPTAYVSMSITEKPIRWEIRSVVEDC
ncbi:MAG: protease complex subunit PrcB family protein [Caldisericia bacterium]|nr:protease complex subunit PrcB family protein [Caldisericia bacterium]MDD4614629.1 protease complex subunit PrcB family protein [Caldisericia bacterium]